MDPKFNKMLANALGTHQRMARRFALVKYGGGIVQMSGSIAGDTFARNRYGNYVRARTKPVNPNTANQVAVRSSLAQVTDNWSQNVTAPQRTAWNLYASNVAMKNKLGETINLTGFNHFIRSNAWHTRRGYATYDDGPVIFELPAKDPAFAITASEATQQITVAYDDTLAWDTETGGFLLVYMGQPQNAQRNFFAGPWRELSNVPGVDGAPVASPLIAAATFAIAEGQRIWAYARILRTDGRISEKFFANTFCAA